VWSWPGQNPYRWSDPTGHYPDGGAGWDRFGHAANNMSSAERGGLAAGAVGALGVGMALPLAGGWFAESALGRWLGFGGANALGQKLNENGSQGAQCVSNALSTGPARDMLNEAMSRASALAPEQRAGALRDLLPQITSANPGWTAGEMPAANGATAFVGGIRGIIVDAAGEMTVAPTRDLGFGLVNGVPGVTGWPGSSP
jgi:hypothetical protein